MSYGGKVKRPLPDIEYTIAYKVPADDTNIGEVLDKMREMGEAEIVGVKLAPSLWLTGASRF